MRRIDLTLAVVFIGLSALACQTDNDVAGALSGVKPTAKVYAGTPNSSPLGVNVGFVDPPGFDHPPNFPSPVYAGHDDWLDWAKKSGAGWVRLDFKMNPDGTLYDTIRVNYGVARAHAKGLSILGLLAGISTDFPNLTTWGNFVQATMARYGDDVPHWEIWNESNTIGHLQESGVPVSGSRYADLVIAAAGSIHAAGGKVVAPSVYLPGEDWSPWLDSVMAKAGASIDAVSWHSYRNYGYEMVNDMSALTAKRAANWSTKPLWGTEIGGNLPFGLAAHADNINAAMRQQASAGNPNDKLFPYQLQEWPRTVTFDENTVAYGILRPTIANTTGNGNTLYSAPVPRASYWAMVRGALYGCTDYPTTCGASGPTVGVHRYRSEGEAAHFYTLDANEVYGVQGWKFEHTDVFYLRSNAAGDPTGGTGLKPLHQCWSPDGHMLTLDSGCESKSGFVYDRQLGYISTIQAPGMVELRRYYRAWNSDWYTTGCYDEMAKAANTGYTYETLLGYVWPGTCASMQYPARYYGYATTHMYTLEDYEQWGQPGWTAEAFDYFGLATGPTGNYTSALYQCFWSGGHYLALDYTNCDGRGGSYDRTLGFISPTSASGLVPLRLYYKSSNTDYIASCATSAPSGYTLQTTLGYVLPVSCSF